MGVAYSAYGKRIDAYSALMRKPEGKRPLGRPSPRWEGNVKLALRFSGMRSTDWIDLAQDRDRWRELVKAVMKGRFP